MLVGHTAKEPLPDELLQFYSAAAALIGQTIARLGELSRLRRRADRLEQILADHAGALGGAHRELAKAHERLESEAALRKQIEDELHQAREAAGTAAVAKNAFLTNMSREIRTPMTAILGFANVLLDNLDRPEDVASAGAVKRNGEFLLRIIDDILDLSKIEAGRFVAEQTPCPPRELIEQAVGMMKIRADAKGLPLLLEFIGPLPQTIRTDPVRLRQILVNLIGNAIKFTADGYIQVEVRLLRNEQNRPLLECKIADTGAGMTRDAWPRFSAVRQGRSLGPLQGRRHRPGAGVEQAARRHAGRQRRHEERTGKGTTGDPHRRHGIAGRGAAGGSGRRR